MPIKLIILDFDGVLYNPNISNFYPQIPHLISQMATDYILAIASYNANAMSILKSNGLSKYFSAWRCGLDSRVSSVQVEPGNTNKLIQVLSISQELRVPLKEIAFFDDLDSNISLTINYVKSIKVDSLRGLTSEYIYGRR